MVHFYASQTYVDASRRLDDACTWLEGLGIDYSRTRVGRYKILFSDFATYQLAKKLDVFFEQHANVWVNAVHEVAELMRMYEGLSGSSDPNLVSRLRNSSRGHELFVLDNDDRSGRDFSFELSVAAKFARHGYEINFGHEADIEVIVEGTTFYVECKRLKSPRKVQSRIKDGLKQLHKRYVKSSDPSNARGLLALAIGKAVNSSLGLLEANNAESLGEKAFAHNAAFIEKYKSYWQINVDQRTLGAVIVLDTPGMLRSEKKLVTVHEVNMNNCISVNTKDYQLLLRVANEVFAREPSPLLTGNGLQPSCASPRPADAAPERER